MIDTKTAQKFESKLDGLLKAAQVAYGRNFSRPKIVFKQIGRTAGYAKCMPRTIILNPDFCKNGHLNDMLEDILPHELAHIISVDRWGIILGRGHKTAWKNTMTILGVEPKRCHSMNLTGVKTRKRKYFTYRCNCRTHEVSSIAHNRIKRGAVYTCRFCKSHLNAVVGVK